MEVKKQFTYGFLKAFCGIMATSMAIPTALTWSMSVEGFLTPILLLIVLMTVALLPGIVGCFNASEHFNKAITALDRGLGNK